MSIGSKVRWQEEVSLSWSMFEFSLYRRAENADKGGVLWGELRLYGKAATGGQGAACKEFE